MSEEKTNLMIDLGKSASIGGGSSAGLAALWPEAIHALSAVIVGVLVATVVFFYNRFLKSRFPEKK